MAAEGKHISLFTRRLDRKGVPLIVATGIPENKRRDLCQRLGVMGIFTDVIDMERATADIRNAEGDPLYFPDATFAAYRLLVERGEAPLKRLRFQTTEGEIQVQGEYFRPAENAQIWREALAPRITPLDSADLGPALGPVLGVGRRDVLGAALVEHAAEPAVMVVLFAQLDALKRAHVGQGARTWLKAQRSDLGSDLIWALHSVEAISPLFDGHIRLVGGSESITGGAASAALITHWARTPKHLAFNAEVGDGDAVFGQVATWVEGEDGQLDRLSIGGHVLVGDALSPAELGL